MHYEQCREKFKKVMGQYPESLTRKSLMRYDAKLGADTFWIQPFWYTARIYLLGRCSICGAESVPSLPITNRQEYMNMKQNFKALHECWRMK